ncbi:heavy metal translocating P-type ATPase [Thalassotalea mangrovi]|uniref:P-type Cu(+) transporter n=1 Tax=Thalassotalea mangrovi TaxID=2572245 RepID=A0A4U1B5S0_9GAMM|nr:heavy metal translocating P-type ATPase [Thalassotalea mangrovi]TKB45829.1 cadmium-translocating P-type ATPase [Thalassotalea mangrovi]
MNMDCFHCGELVPAGLDLKVNIHGKDQPMCCIGCQAVAEAIVDNNLDDYYRFRTEKGNKVNADIPEQLQVNKFVDDQQLQSEFTFESDGHQETILSIDGMSCAACAWLIEKQLAPQSGIIKAQVNATTQRATIAWDQEKIKLSEIISAIARIGYSALPFKANTTEINNNQQSKAFIRRLGVSGILTMQVMMIAFGLYFGAFSDLSEHNLMYLRATSLVLTLPIVTYGAFPFYLGAINALKGRRLTMDVPVAIAISLAFTASCWATFNQQGEVYFESVAMFTFLLLIGKFMEFRARARAAEVSANLLKLMPLSATIIIDNNESIVSAKHLKLGDICLVKPGETIPGDGIIITGNSSVNEAMLTGESAPVSKQPGDQVFAGTVNTDGNLQIKINATNSDNFLTNIIRISEKAQNHKPAIAKLSDKIAQYFVAIILITASLSWFYWAREDASHAFWITISVLVATCPCALSLATPTALTCGTIRLNRQGIMVKSAHVIETMNRIDSWAFDKTGTLTHGKFSLNEVRVYDPAISKDQVLALASALEAYSQHPIAEAFRPYRQQNTQIVDANTVTSCGVEGQFQEKTIRIGKASWIDECSTGRCDSSDSNLQGNCLLAIDNKVVAEFFLDDEIRDDAAQVINELSADADTLLLSGDNEAGVNRLSAALQKQQVKFTQLIANLSAAEKLTTLSQLTEQGKNVAMIGDGVNDAPVFAGAHVSVAMGSGTEIAKTGADVILLDNRLTSLLSLRDTSIRTQRIIKQNFAWAMGYNAIVLPLAVCGFITPYFAVLGMSASSIIVVTNSLRLLKK